MKSFILIFSMLLSGFAHASLGSDYDAMDLSSSDEGYCKSCVVKKLNRELLKSLYEVEVADINSEAIAKVNGLLNFADKCNSFATLNEMGQWGDLILEELKRNRYNELYRGASDLTDACPNFSSMTEDGREVVWVMVVNAMAHLESSCSLGAPAKGPNGSLIGLLQLHNGAEQKYGKYCKKGDGKTAEGTFRCGLSMLEGQLSRDNSLFSRKSYWDVLRPQAKSQKYLKIQKALKNLSICKVGGPQAGPLGEIKNVPIPTPRPTDLSAPGAPEKSETATEEQAKNVDEATTVEDIIAADKAIGSGKVADSLGAQKAP
jgi:hypothetical protein